MTDRLRDTPRRIECAAFSTGIILNDSAMTSISFRDTLPAHPIIVGICNRCALQLYYRLDLMEARAEMERSGTGVRPAGAAARAWDGGGAVSGEEERADAATPGPAAGGAAGASAERVGGSPLRRDAGLLQEALGELIRVLQNRDRDRACCYGLSVSQCHTLQTLVRDGPLTVNELATRLFLDKSTASRLANGLLERGCVGKRSPREDRRVVILQATETGRRLARRIDDDLTEEYAELLAGFDDAVRASLPHLVRRLARVIAGRTDAGEGVECCAQPAGSQT